MKLKKKNLQLYKKELKTKNSTKKRIKIEIKKIANWKEKSFYQKEKKNKRIRIKIEIKNKNKIFEGWH